MSFEFDAPEDVQGESNYLSEPGTYHFVITNVREGEGKKGAAIDGFTVEMDCLAGTAADCAGKSHAESLFKPDMSKSEANQLAANRRLAAFFIATDLMRPDQLGKACKLNLQDCAGRQLIMRLSRQMEKNDATGKWDVPTKFLQIDYAAIFHIDDPEVADIPKATDAFEHIDAAHRHKPEYFAFKEKKHGKPAAKRDPVAATASSSSFDDI